MIEILRERILEHSRGMDALEKGSLIRSLFPKLASRIIEKAEAAMKGMLVLPGTGPEPFFVGNPPLWTDNPSGDNEYTYSLNRMEHIQVLGEAYSLTGDLKYAGKAIAELTDWMEKVEVPPMTTQDGDYNLDAFDGCSPWRALEVGIRGYRTWPIIIETLIDTPCFTEDFLSKLKESIRQHCAILYEISPRLWPKADHNHYLMENLGLMSFTLLFPDLDSDGAMLSHAEGEITRCMDAQCTTEGGQIEGCPSYHNGTVFWFSLRNWMASRFNRPVPESYTARLKKMFTHSILATRPCGGNFPWGDSHTAEKETLCTAAVGCYLATGDRMYLQTALHFYNKATLEADLCNSLWRITDLAKLEEDYKAALACPLAPADVPLVAWNRELKQVYVHSGWDKNDTGLMTACRTPIQNNHAHMDPGGFDFCAYGSPLVSDPGIYTYKDDINRYHFKNTGWHNCVTVNGRDAWQYIASWKCGPQKEGDITLVESGEGFTTIKSEHMNYQPVKLKRILTLLDWRFLIVTDIAEGLTPDDTVQINFHLNTDSVEMKGDASIISENKDCANVHLVSSGDLTGTEIISAKISPANDVWKDSLIVRFAPRTTPRLVHSSAIIPLKPGEKSAKAELTILPTSDEGQIALSFSYKSERYNIEYRENQTIVKKEDMDAHS